MGFGLGTRIPDLDSGFEFEVQTQDTDVGLRMAGPTQNGRAPDISSCNMLSINQRTSMCTFRGKQHASLHRMLPEIGQQLISRNAGGNYIMHNFMVLAPYRVIRVIRV